MMHVDQANITKNVHHHIDAACGVTGMHELSCDSFERSCASSGVRHIPCSKGQIPFSDMFFSKSSMGASMSDTFLCWLWRDSLGVIAVAGRQGLHPHMN